MKQPGELFNNGQVEISALPSADLLEMMPLEKAYKTVRYISGFIMAGIILFITWTFTLLQIDWWPYSFYGAGLITIIAIWIILYQGMSYYHMGYALREKDISFKSGLWWRSMTTVPFNRVQHCDLKQGILDRRFGLSKLTIYTAGGQSTDLMIPGLLPATAERLKSFILHATEQAAEES